MNPTSPSTKCHQSAYPARACRWRRGVAPVFLLVCMLWLTGGWLRTSLAASDAPSPAPEQSMQAGSQSFSKGDFTQALDAWTRAAAAYQAAGNVQRETLALVRSADAYIALGRYPQAFQQLRRALGLSRKTNDARLVTTVTASLGNAYALAGSAPDAERALRTSIEMGQKLNDMSIVASASNNLGNVLAAQQRHEEAAESYRQALEAAQRTGDKSLAVRIRINRARSLIEARRYSEAAAQLAAAHEQIAALAPSHDKAYELISTGRLYANLAKAPDAKQTGLLQRAYDALSGALAVATGINDERARSYALGYTGELYEQARHYEDAQELTQQAIFAAQQANAPEAQYRWQWQSGRLLKAQGQMDQAILSYRHAVATLQTVRHDLSSGYGETHRAFRESVGPLYFELADLLLQRSASVSDDQQRQHYLVDARDTVELLKGAELQDYFQDDCVAALKAKTTGIDQLSPHTAALYPIILPDRMELLVSFPDGMKRFTTPVTGARVTGEIRTFRRLLEKKTTHEYLPHAQQLYEWIIRPIESELKRQDVKTLVIVPDTALRTVPMAALYDGKHFLIERYAIATEPGLTLVDPRPIERKRVELLVAGLTESVQGFPPLPYVAREIRDIDGLYPSTVVLENRNFVTSKVEGELERKPFSIVHVASHAEFSKDISKTFLLTYNSKLDMNELEKLLAPTRFRKNAVELLTLSACQTAAGDDRAALGLAGVAVKAGARSAVATLWLVNDPAAAQLTSNFYRQLKDPSVSKAKALQEAQLSLLKDRRYWHPGYWSPFLLIGTWL